MAEIIIAMECLPYQEPTSFLRPGSLPCGDTEGGGVMKKSVPLSLWF